MSAPDARRRALTGLGFMLFAGAIAGPGCTGSIDGHDSPRGTTVVVGPDGVARPAPGGKTTGATGSTTGATGAAPADPGFTVVRRLNATEYCNTLSDLLGVDEQSCTRFPTEGAVGFDTIGQFLETSPLHLEVFDATIESALDKFFLLPATSPARKRVLPCDPAAGDEAGCVKQIVARFGRLAWRRPALDADVTSYAGFYARTRAAGYAAPDALRAALHAMLLSPRFAFKREHDDDPAATRPHALDGYELATRLSYALWATMPDDELSAVADAGKLTDPAALEAQIGRMLAHAKARSLVTNFAGQWLHSRDIPGHESDPKAYPALTPEIKRAMADELENTFAAYLAGDRRYRDMASAEVSIGVTDKLASYLGLPPANAAGERSLSATNRRGLLGAAGIHVVTARGARTSYVARGVFVLDNVLCRKPADPPPGVPTLPDNVGQKTKRQISVEHRSSPVCAICHEWIDPIGLGLENFDAAGRWRTIDELGNPVEALGELPGATANDPRRPFNGPVELATLLASDDVFSRCVADRFLTYSVGRLLDDDDGHAWSAAIAGEASRRGGRLRDLIVASLTSPLFRSRRAEGVMP